VRLRVVSQFDKDISRAFSPRRWVHSEPRAVVWNAPFGAVRMNLALTERSAKLTHYPASGSLAFKSRFLVD
jgi:hypothetical protein